MNVISVEQVSKKFMLAHDKPTNLADAARGLFQRKHRQEFWALKDVSFEVKRGEALGIIGHNGAGKSTMLKLLTRIMEPTNGQIYTEGRVSALIEVGAGFHPEMTGRENIYLNGSILGMSRREISSKFDAIVSFAELEKFIDTPVKRYSSGMYVRLGFAVMAHIDPEILLLDEVLSVGDERFQIKCQELMRGLMDNSGTTVLFVSHNLRAVAAMCPRSLVIRQGQCIFDGPSDEAIRVMRRNATLQMSGDGSAEEADSQVPVFITGARVVDENSEEVESVGVGGRLMIELLCHANQALDKLNFGVEIMNSEGVMCYDVNSGMDGYFPSVPAGDFVVEFEVPKCLLADGVYCVTAGIMDQYERIHYHAYPKCAVFTVRDDEEYRGIARLGHKWGIRLTDAQFV